MKILSISAVLLCCSAQLATAENQPEYSPYLNDDFPNQVFFGDTHLHTSYSADAGFVGTTLAPEEAGRLMKLATVASNAPEPEGFGINCCTVPLP